MRASHGKTIRAKRPPACGTVHTRGLAAPSRAPNRQVAAAGTVLYVRRRTDASAPAAHTPSLDGRPTEPVVHRHQAGTEMNVTSQDHRGGSHWHAPLAEIG